MMPKTSDHRRKTQQLVIEDLDLERFQAVLRQQSTTVTISDFGSVLLRAVETRRVDFLQALIAAAKQLRVPAIWWHHDRFIVELAKTHDLELVTAVCDCIRAVLPAQWSFFAQRFVDVCTEVNFGAAFVDIVQRFGDSVPPDALISSISFRRCPPECVRCVCDHVEPRHFSSRSIGSLLSVYCEFQNYEAIAELLSTPAIAEKFQQPGAIERFKSQFGFCAAHHYHTAIQTLLSAQEALDNKWPIRFLRKLIEEPGFRDVLKTGLLTTDADIDKIHSQLSKPKPRTV